MSDINICILVGEAGAPRLYEREGKVPLTSFPLMTRRRIGPETYRDDRHNCVAIGDRAKAARAAIHQGDRVQIRGSVEYDEVGASIFVLAFSVVTKGSGHG